MVWKIIFISLLIVVINICYLNRRKNKLKQNNKSISVATSDGETVVSCINVKTTNILFPRKNEPRYVLLGVEKISFWREHSQILAWYEKEEDARLEESEIKSALDSGDTSYTLRYFTDIDVKLLTCKKKGKK